MAMDRRTMAEKLFARKLPGKEVAPGEIVTVEPDLIGMHDILGHVVVDIIESLAIKELKAANRTAIFIDHAAPPPSPLYAKIHKQLRDFARRHGIKMFYDVGYGIMHQVVFEEALVKPWDFFIASDSHTVTLGAAGAFATGMGSTDIAYAIVTGETWMKIPESHRIELTGRLREWVYGKDLALALIGMVGLTWANYRALEFTGEGLRGIPMADRLTVSNMSVEMGAKAGLFEVDPVAVEHYKGMGVSVRELHPDRGAHYRDELTIELEGLEPMIAAPPSLDNVKPVSELEGLEVDEVFIGSCTNGREEDFEAAARILKGGRVHERVRCIAIPATRKIYLSLLRKDIVDTLASAGCTVTYGTCGPCWGGHFGVAGPGEVVLSTSNRNFIGRMGDPSAKIYLSNPAVAAATALKGEITDPRTGV